MIISQEHFQFQCNKNETASQKLLSEEEKNTPFLQKQIFLFYFFLESILIYYELTPKIVILTKQHSISANIGFHTEAVFQSHNIKT